MKVRRVSTPLATYRLQLTPSFTLTDAANVVPYIAGLGVSHLYLSPIFAAAPGSEHGYDVLDHSRVNEELGGVAAFYTFRRAAEQCGLGIILDIVPNHVGLAGGANRWWRDVMRYGRASEYAPYFDIDWDGQAYLPAGLLVYPILGKSFGEALEAGEMTVGFEDGEIQVHYFEHAFPIAPQTYPMVIGLPPPSLATNEPSAPGALAEIVDALGRATAADCPAALNRLSDLAAAEPVIRAFVAEQAAALNGQPGEPASFDRLEQVLGAQPYRLASWRVSAEEINYRRFFDINDLAAIRVEHQPVFDDVHRLVKELADGGFVDGLRVDHVDGLYDPQSYLARLDNLLNGHSVTPSDRRPIYVEKILAWDERLPEHWATAGTTGYDALARFDRIFADAHGEEALTDIYAAFTGRPQDFGEVAFAARRRTVERTFAGELNVLATHLHRLAQRGRRTRDITLRAHHDAIAAFVACLPVYRMYLDDGQPRGIDDGIIHRTAADASAHDPNAPTDALEFLCEVLLLQGVEGHPEEHERRVHFRRRLQQLSSPVMAKGMEDTAFYRYNRLLSLNEVGASPGQFGASLAELHEWFGERARVWPHALSATTTHDTKRSEDARARLNVLSELPREWRREVRAWARLNARFVSTGDGWRAPDPNLEYYYYQTLLAAWEGPPTTAFRQRIATHMTKAMREAKERTAWTRVNESFEEGVQAFVRATLDGRRSRRFIERVQRFSDRMAPAAAANSLGMLTLKATAPGIPDFYQGSERVLITLTDPDNRSPVEYPASEVLTGDDGFDATAPLAGQKFALMRALLGLRARRRDLFARGAYVPIEVAGGRREHVFAFVRQRGSDRVLVVVPRLVATFAHGRTGIPREAWGDTTVHGPPSQTAWRHLLTGEEFSGGGSLSVGDLLGGAPVGVFEGRSER